MWCQQTLALWVRLSLLVLDGQVFLKAFLVAATLLTSSESFYTVDDINKLFYIYLQCLLKAYHFFLTQTCAYHSSKLDKVKGKQFLLE